MHKELVYLIKRRSSTKKRSKFYKNKSLTDLEILNNKESKIIDSNFIIYNQKFIQKKGKGLKSKSVKKKK